MQAHRFLLCVLLGWALAVLAAPVPVPPKISYKPYGLDPIPAGQKTEIGKAVNAHAKKTDPNLTGFHATAPFHISATDGTPHVTGFAKTGPKGSAPYQPQGERQTHIYLADGQQWKQPPNVGATPGKLWTGSDATQRHTPPQGPYRPPAKR